jgi:predicted transcriptional regulator
MIGRAPDLFVLGRVLGALATAPGPQLKTPLQQRAGMNYTVFQRYLEFVLRHGLVAPSPRDPDRFELTPKGVEAYRFLTDGIERIFGAAPGAGPAVRNVGPTERGGPTTRPGTS